MTRPRADQGSRSVTGTATRGAAGPAGVHRGHRSGGAVGPSGWARTRVRPRATLSAWLAACTPGGPVAPSASARRARASARPSPRRRSEEHTSELQSRQYLVCRLLLEKKKKIQNIIHIKHI